MAVTRSRLLLVLIVVGVLALGTSPAAAAGVASAGGWNVLGEHTVKSSETLYCIGRAYGVDPWAIAVQNDVAFANVIHPGQVLDIPNVPKSLPAGRVCAAQFGDAHQPPAPAPTPVPPAPPAPRPCGGCTCRWTHTVAWGQTLSWISIYYGADVYSIAHCNCIYNLNYIRAGATLCIP